MNLFLLLIGKEWLINLPNPADKLLLTHNLHIDLNILIPGKAQRNILLNSGPHNSLLNIIVINIKWIAILYWSGLLLLLIITFVLTFVLTYESFTVILGLWGGGIVVYVGLGFLELLQGVFHLLVCFVKRHWEADFVFS